MRDKKGEQLKGPFRRFVDLACPSTGIYYVKGNILMNEGERLKIIAPFFYDHVTQRPDLSVTKGSKDHAGKRL